jgi:hypothetical protein
MFAVVFLTVVGLVAVALGTMATGGLLAANGLSNQRSTEYAADAAVDVAIQAVRYSYSYFPTAAWCLPPLSGGTGSSATTVSGLQVACSGAQSLFGSSTRTVTFTACQGLTLAACSGATTQGQVVQASVSFDDDEPPYTCSSSSTTTCGFGMTIDSWVVLTTNS